MSNDKMLALRGRRAVWAPVPKDTGPIDPSRLPEGYPYKEQSETVLMEETTVQHNGNYNATNYEAFVVGEKYNVTFDGVNYEVTAQMIDDSDGMYSYEAIGNGSLYYSANTDSGEPFVMYGRTSSVGEFYVIYVNDNSVTHTVKISKLSETTHPMSEEFLPEGMVIAEKLLVRGDSIFSESSGELSYGNTKAKGLYFGTPKLSALADVIKDGDTVEIVYSGNSYNCSVASKNGDGAAPFIIGNRSLSVGTADVGNGEMFYMDTSGDTIWISLDIYSVITITAMYMLTEGEGYVLSKDIFPKAAAVADVTAAPTADEFNALLASLRAAGYLATE